MGLTGTAACAQDIYVSSKPSANFLQYRTYARGQQQNPNQTMNSFLAQEATAQVNAQSQGKGLTDSSRDSILIVD